jgi:type IV secretory pathway VirD2 relaxase
VHIVVNGRDDTGADLVINGDYLSAGLRERASEPLILPSAPSVLSASPARYAARREPA